MGFLLLGIDSLIACFGVGALVGRRSWLSYAALFGVCDAGGFLLGIGASLEHPGRHGQCCGDSGPGRLGRVLARHRAVRTSTRRDPVGLGSSVRAEHRQHHLWSDRPRVVFIGGGPGHRAVGVQLAARSRRPARERCRHARNPGQDEAERYFRCRVRRGRVHRRGTGPARHRLADTGNLFCRDSGQRSPGLKFSHGHRWPVGADATRRSRPHNRRPPAPVGSARPHARSPGASCPSISSGRSRAPAPAFQHGSIAGAAGREERR